MRSDWAKSQVAARVPKADLDQRDPDYIRDQLPGLWLLASVYFRADVRGLDRIPTEGPVLLVGNHSGGNLPPDTFVFTLAFCSYFGVERPFYQLAHNLVVSMPGPGITAQIRHRRREPRQRHAGPAVRRRIAGLPRRRLRGVPAVVEAPPGRLRRPQGLCQARPGCRCPDRADRQRRRPGGGPVPRPRAVAGQAADGRQDDAAEERADPLGAPVGTGRSAT